MHAPRPPLLKRRGLCQSIHDCETLKVFDITPSPFLSIMAQWINYRYLGTQGVIEDTAGSDWDTDILLPRLGTFCTA